MKRRGRRMARNSIGIMLVSGMIAGSLFTLFVVPSIYVLVARTRAGVPAGDAAPTVDPGRDLPVGETSPA